MIKDASASEPNKFRRGVAVFLPFLISLYGVLLSQFYLTNKSINFPYYLLLIGGLLIGFGFMYWISGMAENNELFATLSCFVSSLIFFAVLTVFIITRSFEIISFVFGFLFGVCVHVVRYGFTNIDRLKIPIGKSIRKLINRINKNRKISSN
ncbi:MAG: hypothetical protein AB2L18_05785 [Anaerolineaceae bacterium]